MAEKKMQVGSLHHQMTTVKDMDEAIHLYQDVLGLKLTARLFVPNDVIEPEIGSQEVWADGIDHIWEIATLDNGKGAPIELCHPIWPAVEMVNTSGYGFTGHTEQGFAVEDIDAWYDWIVENGYTPQSKPWPTSPGVKTFCFFDKEGNVIQLTDDSEQPAIPHWPDMGYPIADFRTPEQKAWAEKTYR
jgi:catechol 2,3-dioxygenase-like lactoylglutathione lyase family enzyme